MCDQLLTPTEREQFNVMHERLRAAYARERPIAGMSVIEVMEVNPGVNEYITTRDKLIDALTKDLEAMVEVGTKLIDRPRSAREMIVGYCEVDRLARQALARVKP